MPGALSHPGGSVTVELAARAYPQPSLKSSQLLSPYQSGEMLEVRLCTLKQPDQDGDKMKFSAVKEQRKHKWNSLTGGATLIGTHPIS